MTLTHNNEFQAVAQRAAERAPWSPVAHWSDKALAQMVAVYRVWLKKYSPQHMDYADAVGVLRVLEEEQAARDVAAMNRAGVARD